MAWSWSGVLGSALSCAGPSLSAACPFAVVAPPACHISGRASRAVTSKASAKSSGVATLTVPAPASAASPSRATFTRPVLKASEGAPLPPRGPGVPTPAPSSVLGSAPSAASRLRIFSGTCNPELSREITSYLGVDLGRINIKRFADGEIYVQIEESIRGCDVFLVQPTSPPVNDHLVELLITIDACRRASARSITAVLPYFGYARADRKVSGRESIGAKLVANVLTEAGVDRVLALDLHSGQCVGYFDLPVDHVHGDGVILDYLASKRIPSGDLVVVSPDVGGVARARSFAKKLDDAPLAIVDKRRTSHNVSEVMNVIGEVRDKVAVLVDDLIDTAGTITNAARVLKDHGARKVYACATHAVLSPPAIERLSSGAFAEVIVTNTIPLPKEAIFPELTVLSVANLLGETIWRVYNSASVESIRGR